MKVVAFDVKSSIAHFRRPDTTATQLTYPFMPPTAAKGLVGAILGIEDFVTRDQVGIQLLSPVKVVSQQLSLLGKGGGNVFNRPTTIQLLIRPAYRIYYGGEEYVDKLEEYLKSGCAVYPTYLGSCFALTKPKYVNTWHATDISLQNNLTTRTVIPASVIKELELQPNHHFQRAYGFFKNYLGDRTFEQSIDYIYEENSNPTSFLPKPEVKELNIAILETKAGETICLV
ncbi:MAG: CRISPR-associated protein Cas5 [Firmicutes bacterium]|nr:CRISPR-associated protein Cas5 [Bacillota bacterium]